MKQSMDDHLKGLARWQYYHDRLKDRADTELRKVKDAEKIISHYEAQIAEAKRRGLNGFDRAKFLKPKPKKEKTT